MNELRLPADAAALLAQTHAAVLVCDPGGRALGRFEPLTASPRGECPFTRGECPFTREELDRFAAEPGGRSLSEILGDLERGQWHPSHPAGVEPVACTDR